MVSYQDIVPYTAVFIDAEWQHFLRAVQWSTFAAHDRRQLIADIQSKWTISSNPNAVLPVMSVRTGLDLFLRVKNYPPGTEIIMSAVNIPDMVRIVHAHGLKVISIDVDLETMAPKLSLLEMLVTSNTKLLLVANIYGRRFDMEPVIAAARQYDLVVIEDFAEGFGGFDYVGHRDTDLALFSFGSIKYETAFGGAVAKVKDQDTYQRMLALYDSDPMQSQFEYLKKVMKYLFVYMFLDCPKIVKPAMFLARSLNVDHKKFFVGMLRGFPDQLLSKIRYQPCSALLALMRLRFTEFDAAAHQLTNVKHEYVFERLPAAAMQVGSKAHRRNHWLCPIVVDDPDEVVKGLNELGIDAYRGATQLNIIEPDNGHNDQLLSPLSNLDKFVTHYPHEAKYLIDHVIYLPVNKMVPFCELDRICNAVASVLSSPSRRVNVREQRNHQTPVKILSKL